MLKDKVGLVTGAGSGIGRAIALGWAREGVRVVVSDINAEHGEKTADMLRSMGCEAIYVSADVSKTADCEAAVAACVKHFGRLDMACNNAGIGGPSAAVADYPLDGWADVISINLSGVFYAMQHEIRAMLKTGGGSIINMASILGAVGSATSPAYTAAKHGVVGLTQSAALAYSAQGIRINAVAPGYIRTPMLASLEADPAVNAALVAQHPIGRLGQPEEVAELVVWLSSGRASFVTGAYLPVDGGYLAR